jgi:hypothetical protein
LLKLAKESVLKGSYSVAVGYIDRALQGIGSGHDEQPKGEKDEKDN